MKIFTNGPNNSFAASGQGRVDDTVDFLWIVCVSCMFSKSVVMGLIECYTSLMTIYLTRSLRLNSSGLRLLAAVLGTAARGYMAPAGCH